eukprot:m.85295 g.85295  ORF g.85295 m.85295 type:complete len:65 (-) comp14839_c2_seq2:208-402(-)
MRIVRLDRGHLYAKAIATHDQLAGVVVVVTNKLLVVSGYRPDMAPAVCVEATEKIGKYLREKGR